MRVDNERAARKIQKNEKKCEKGLTNLLRRVYIECNDMPNQPARDKKWVSVLLKRETIKKLEKLAKFRGKTRTDIMTALIDEGVSHIELTRADYESLIKDMSEK